MKKDVNGILSQMSQEEILEARRHEAELPASIPDPYQEQIEELQAAVIELAAMLEVNHHS